MVNINEVLSKNLTKNTKIVHFTQKIDILRKTASYWQFPIEKLVDLLVRIWYNDYRRILFIAYHYFVSGVLS